MISIPPFADAQAYLESLMQAGQDAMKQFDDALTSATGAQPEEPHRRDPGKGPPGRNHRTANGRRG